MKKILTVSCENIWRNLNLVASFDDEKGLLKYNKI